MDIAKIRKKMQEKEKETGKVPGPKSVEPAAEEKQGPQNIPEEAVKEDRTKNEEQPALREALDAGEKTAGTSKEEDKEDDINEALLELLTFSISKEEFAFRVTEVEEILRLQKITKVPTMPDYVLGITSLRGKIIPVIDLEMRLGIKRKGTADTDEDAEKNEDTDKKSHKKILIISGPRGMIGATIDRVGGVIKVPKGKVLPPPAHLTEAELKFLEGVVIFEKRFISMIMAEDTMKLDIS